MIFGLNQVSGFFSIGSDPVDFNPDFFYWTGHLEGERGWGMG